MVDIPLRGESSANTLQHSGNDETYGKQPFYAGRPAGVELDRRVDMFFLIEDLARERIREIQRDSERAWQVKQARVARRAAKARNAADR